MPRCVGTAVTKSGRQCKSGGTYGCPKCGAALCSWHVRWNNGAWCPWCKVEMRIREYGTGELRDPKTMDLTQVGRGLYRRFEDTDANMDR